MNVVDSSAWLSYFAGDKNAGAGSECHIYKIKNINGHGIHGRTRKNNKSYKNKTKDVDFVEGYYSSCKVVT